MSISIPPYHDTRINDLLLQSSNLLPQRSGHAPMTRVEFCKFAERRLSVELDVFTGRSTRINLIVHPGEKGCYSISEPPLTTELEPTQVTSPIGAAQHGVWVLLELFVGYTFFVGDLPGLVKATDTRNLNNIPDRPLR